MATVAKPVISVSVREIVEFVLRTGDLGGERDFVGRDRALAGTRGHQQIQRSRPAGYQKEVRLSFDLEAEDFTLRIQGRIDGLLSTSSIVLLEEIKTIAGSWSRVADPLHWAQAKIYGFIYARQHDLERIDLRLTYLDLKSGELTEFADRSSFPELLAFFEETTGQYLQWVREQRRWLRQRDQSIQTLGFPFSHYRPGQRELAVAVYRAIAQSERLFLEAPTGIGKTISVIFPTVKAMGEGKVERMFYLTARTTGRVVAEEAFGSLRAAGVHLRTLTLTAREKVCVRNGQPCDPRSCPLAVGYYDRRKTAMRAVLEHAELNRALLETMGQLHQVCPFELSLDLSTWVDAVICDYNYAFDPRVYLRRQFDEDKLNCVLLVDEAHNLVDRAREMFSAEIRSEEVHQVRRALQHTLPRCAKSLDKLNAALRRLCQGATASNAAEEPVRFEREPSLFPSERTTPSQLEAAPDAAQPADFRAAQSAVSWTKELPVELARPIEDLLREAESWLVRNEPAEFREDLLALYFSLHWFSRTLERSADGYMTLIEGSRAGRVKLFCLDPSFQLKQALARGQAAVLFSATLTPMDYFRDLLGGNPEDPILRLPSPFPPENLAVVVQDRIRTHFKARAESLGDVVEAIATVVNEKRGNYLVYFPSYQYLSAVCGLFQSRHPAISVLAQKPAMSEQDRTEFLASFVADHDQPLVGFAVMGGIFGEGIDLVGDRLIGAIIVGVGLPQLCVERDLIREYFQRKSGTGFDYAYTFPGMNRVLQATGRVIRSESDRGVVLLIDTRFAEPRYRRLFPAWWRIARVRNVEQIRTGLRQFWDPSSEPV